MPGHHGVVRGALFQQNFSARIALAHKQSAGNFAARHRRAFGSLVLAQGAAFCLPTGIPGTADCAACKRWRRVP